MPSERKSSYLDVAKGAQGIRAGLGGFRGALSDFRTGQIQPQRAAISAQRQAPRPDIDTARTAYKNIIDNPAARGFDAATLNKMRGVQSDVAAGQRGSYLKDMNRQVRAQGLGNTGAALRNQRQYTESAEPRLRAAFRDIDIENAKQGRGEYLEAVKAMPGIQGIEDQYNSNMFQLENQVLGQEQNTYGLESSTYPMETQTLNPEMAAYQQAYKPGFWGQFGSSFANSLGSGLAGFATGGVQGAGYNLGRRAVSGGGRTNTWDIG